MSESKFTKGPWLASQTMRVHGAVPSSDGVDICSADNANIGLVYWAENGSRSETRANANLIAAAPELLEALKACHLQMLQSNNSSEYAEEANQMAIAAIAKAEGRQ
jgi:hypothetical protein